MPEYWLGTNVDTSFFQVSTLEFGHVAVGRVKGRRLCTPAQQWAPGSCVHTVFVIYGAVHCSSCYAHVSKWFLQGRNAITTYTVTYRLVKVWTQLHLVPVPKYWSSARAPNVDFMRSTARCKFMQEALKEVHETTFFLGWSRNNLLKKPWPRILQVSTLDLKKDPGEI